MFTPLLPVIGYPFIVAFIVTALATPVTIWFMKKFGIMDDPAQHQHPGRIHTKPVPRGGGIPLYVGCLIAALFFLPITNITVAIFFSALLMLVIGVIDDKLNARNKDVSPYIRFFIIILCAVILVGSGITIPYITNPFGGILHLDTIRFSVLGLLSISLSDFLAIIWIIWVVNMLNWSSGVDGQMPGIVAISTFVIGLLSLRVMNTTHLIPIDATLAFIIAGSAVGFLIYHFHPAKIFPGYGASALYLLLAVVSMLSSAKLATAILVMAVPTVDAAFTILRRLLNKRSPFLGDKKHLHHILLKRGLSQRQIALCYWAFSAILGAISLLLNSRSKLFAMIMVVVIVGMALLFLHSTTRGSHET